jgi:hypothetical protein
MKKLTAILFVMIFLMATMVEAYCGFWGYVKKQGLPVDGAEVVFKNHTTGDYDTTYTDANGRYDQECAQGWYWAKASDGPYWIHVKDSVYQTGQITGTRCDFNLINIAK